MRWTMRFAMAATAVLIGTAALAQEAFPAKSLEAMAASDQVLARQQKKTADAGDLLFIPGPDSGARAPATYAGQSRPVTQRRAAFILTFASSAMGNDGYGQRYEREYLFRSGGKDFWLPVQTQVAAYFARELKAGQPVLLYLRNAGGFRTEAGWDWVFLVEEFEGPANAKAPDGKTPSRPPIPAGPKVQT